MTCGGNRGWNLIGLGLLDLSDLIDLVDLPAGGGHKTVRGCNTVGLYKTVNQTACGSAGTKK